MKFPRNARIFRGRLDAAPFAAVLFLLVIFLMLASLVYTPGVSVDLPAASDLPGIDNPSVSVGMDAGGRLYFDNQSMEEPELRTRLRAAASHTREPLTLIIQADKAVRYERVIQLALLARDAGIRKAVLATLPRPLAARAPQR